MKKIYILNTGAVRILKDQIPHNIEQYQSGSQMWLNELFADKRKVMQSPVDDPEIALKVGLSHSTEYDAYNAQLLYEGYSTLTPAMAADERLWVTLCHNQHYSYMLKRWPVDPDVAHHQSEEGIIKQRYFFSFGPRKSQERNGLSRLWLSAALTYDPERTDPYELTKIFLQDTNFIMYMFGHTFGSNKRIVQGTMEAILQLQLERGEKISAKPLTSFTRKLNLISGVAMLDNYSRQDIRSMAENHMRTYLAQTENAKVLTSIC